MAQNITKLDAILVVMVFLNLSLIGYVLYARNLPVPQMMAQACASPETIAMEKMTVPEPMSGTPQIAGKKISYRHHETLVDCGGVQSKIIADCTKGENPVCKNQRWVLNDKTIKLNNRQKIHAWACLPSQSDSKIIFFTSGGHSNLWTAQGTPVKSENPAPRYSFNRK